jgi:hypothetical protein
MWDGLIHPLPAMFMKDKPPGGLKTMNPSRIIVEGQMSRVVAGGAEESYKQPECGTCQVQTKTLSEAFYYHLTLTTSAQQLRQTQLLPWG